MYIGIPYVYTLFTLHTVFTLLTIFTLSTVDTLCYLNVLEKIVSWQDAKKQKLLNNMYCEQTIMTTKTTTAKRPLSDFLWVLNEKEADLLEKTIKRNRKMHSRLHEERIKKIVKEIN